MFEDKPVGSQVTRVVAYDQDSGDYGNVNYRIIDNEKVTVHPVSVKTALELFIDEYDKYDKNAGKDSSVTFKTRK